VARLIARADIFIHSLAPERGRETRAQRARSAATGIAWLIINEVSGTRRRRSVP
jgi:hypothetical protein